MPVHLGGLKTETGKFFLHFQLVCVLGNFLYLPQIVSMCVLGGGLKTETGKFLLHFQNSKSSNRCWSVYGTDIKKKLLIVKFSNTTPLPLTIFGEGQKLKLAILKLATIFGGGPETNWQFWGALKTETHNSETGNNILGGLKTETGNFGEV